jgi:hypothetical protein
MTSPAQVLSRGGGSMPRQAALKMSAGTRPLARRQGSGVLHRETSAWP